jgi:hypothetical protein
MAYRRIIVAVCGCSTFASWMPGFEAWIPLNMHAIVAEPPGMYREWKGAKRG